MKIIDQTPYFDENGQIRLIDRGRALMKFGADWINEIEAQKTIIAVLDKTLDKKFTLLRNITPAGLGAAIPFILVGPTGVFVMSVTHLTGTLSARGDQWGTISGDTFRPGKLNLLTRTEKMARAVQVFLQRQGYTDLLSVEPILLCADPTTHVDTARPIIRVIMRDALERFAISISQAHVVLSAESVFDIVNRILNPPAESPTKEGEGAESPDSGGANGTDEKSAENETSTVLPRMGKADEMYTPDNNDTKQNQTSPFTMAEAEGSAFPEGQESMESVYLPDSLPESEASADQPVQRKPRITRKQWIFLIVMFVVWIIIMAVFAFLIVRDLIL